MRTLLDVGAVVEMKGPFFLLLLLPACLPLLGQSKPAVQLPQPKLEINSASQSELEQLPGIGPERARWMIETRERNGAFRCVDELRAMPRLSDRQFDTLRPLVFVTEPEPRCELASRRSTK